MTPPSSQGGSAKRYQPEQGPQWRFPDMPGEAAQQPQQYPQYPLKFPDMPAPGSTARARRSGLQTGGWITVIVATAVIVGIVVWLGLNASKVPTGTVEEREALSEVQTPDDDAPAPANENNVLVPAFAPWAPGTKIQTTDHRPAPGEHFTAQSCTAAFSFTGKDGRAYAVTAGHCGREGDLVWPTNASTAFDYASEVGHFIFSGLYSQNTRRRKARTSASSRSRTRSGSWTWSARRYRLGSGRALGPSIGCAKRARPRATRVAISRTLSGCR